MKPILPGRLSEALLAAEQCGLAPEELAAGEAVLKEAPVVGVLGFRV